MRPLWNIYEVARALSISTATVRRLWGRGEFIEPIRVGHGLRWRPADVEAWLNDIEQKAGASSSGDTDQPDASTRATGDASFSHHAR